ncbi:Rho GTPase-activating protein 1 [Sesamum alatum]|uniref:Rho GTPase-activating protein 1 n=1 Tax=Sesamum alatum TaxID=300844 RepID=A0AAE1XXG0_9LAMI|nr:Rho GTPase-activating protein 1 [Sesamum alatum]
MTDILHSPPQLSSPSSSISCSNDGLPQHTNFLDHDSLITSNLYRRSCGGGRIREGVVEGNQLPVLSVLVDILRKSLVGCSTSVSGIEEQLMEIGWPTNVRHVAHVTFDRFNGFLGLPVEFEPEVPRRPPSASTRVFGVSTESMQLSFDSRGNCVPTILLMMQRRLYSQGGLQSEGIFRINPENGQEEYVREQLNNGLIPDNIDVHCLAGLIKAWFRELPRGVLDSLSPDEVMQAQSEDECTQLVRLLPPTEAALLDWAINLMADVAQFEHLNKMNARNVAMVFAPNMTQMSDPLTALMYAVQVMNFLKTLIVKTLREREDSAVEAGRVLQFEPSDEDGHHSLAKPLNLEAGEVSEDEQVNIAKEPTPNDTINSTSSQAEPKTDNKTHGFLSSIENILLPDGKEHTAENASADIPNSRGTTKDGVEAGNTSVGSGKTQSRIRRTKCGQPSNSNSVKKGSRKHAPRPVVHATETADKNKEISIISRVNSHTERTEAWRETHLWYVKPSEVKSESLLKEYLDILSPCERKNVLQMGSEELRKSALLARALVRTTIARYQINSEINPRSLKFRKNIHGKPEVEWQYSDDWHPPPLHFNISHTSSLVACGVTINSQIGIDVEEKQRSIKHNILSFARRYFSEHEVRFLAAISDPQVQRMEFIKLWTLKEAYVKALGKGFSGAPFKTFTIRSKSVPEEGFNKLEGLSPKASEIVVDSFDNPTVLTSNWRFLLLELVNSHYAAICIEKHGASEGNRNVPVKLTVWKTIPFLEDECVSGTDAVKTICGL